MHYFHSFVIFLLFVITFPLASFAQESTPSLAARPPQIVESDLVQVGCAYSRDFLNMPMWIQWGIDDVSEHATEILADQSWYLYTDIFLDNLEPGTRYVYQCVGETDLGDMYNSEILDVVTDPYPATLFNVSYAYHTIHDGDVVWHDDWDLERLSSREVSYWRYYSYWERAVANQRAHVLIIKGTFGNIEGGVPEEHVNYSAQVQAWQEGGGSIGKHLDIGRLHRTDAWTGTYTVMLAEAYRNSQRDGILEWFASGGESGIEPRDHAMLTFEYKGVRPETTPPMLSYATSTAYGGDGIHPDKGVADEDELTFAVVYTDAENDAPEYVRTWVRDDEGVETFLDMIPASESGAGADAPAPLTDGNYQNGELFTAASTFPKGTYTYTFLTKESTENADEQSFPAQLPEDSSLSFQTGYSSVAFLPGIGGSRLYLERGEGELVWEPDLLNDIDYIAIDPATGTSEDPNIAVKGITDEIFLRLDAWPTTNVYKSFMQYMDDEVVGKELIAEWKPLAYDWRLGFDELLSHGNLIGTDNGTDIVVFSETSDTPYLISELERMAENSDSGKVTILTHSNGGLLAKYLLAHLEEEINPLLDSIDDVILVASPQIGTPEAAATLLHGTTKLGKGKERDAAEDMYSAHHLLPSPTYFETVSDPVFAFSDEVGEIPELIDFVGTTIGGSGAYAAFVDFLTGHGGTWSEPTDVDAPNVLHDSHIAYAERVHGIIDSWTPPEHIDVIQIAGWGLDTTYAIEYDDWDLPLVTQTLETLDRKLLKTEHGDGTVVLASAIAMEGVDGVETYYVNLPDYNDGGARNRKHASILESNDLQDFLKNMLGNTNEVYDYIYETSPFSAESKDLYITMHSPVNIHAYVGDLHTGIVEVPGSDLRYYEEEISNSSYSEWNEVKEIVVPHGEEVILSLEGYDEGTFTLEIEEKEGDETLSQAVFTDIPVQEGSASEIVFASTEDVTELAIDNDGDGDVDTIALSDEEKETVDYDTLRVALNDLPKWTKKMLKKQIAIAEKLHNRGNVVAAKATLMLIKKEITRLDCTKAKREWQKKRCIPSEDVVRMTAIVNVLLEQLEEPVKERKEEIKEKTKSWLEKMKERLRKQ